MDTDLIVDSQTEGIEHWILSCCECVAMPCCDDEGDESSCPHGYDYPVNEVQ